MTDTYLVLGAGGQQGRAIVNQLRQDGHRVRGLRRQVPGEIAGVEWAAGDLTDPDSLRRAFDGVTHAALTIPLTLDEAAAARAVADVIAAAERVGLTRLVFNTGNRRIGNRTGVAAFDLKRDAEDALLASGVPTVVLRPPLFIDNLAAPWAQAALADGVLPYPVPAGHRVAWLSHHDLAAAVAAAFARDELAGESIDVGGPDVLTGPELAAAFADVRGRPVEYVPLDVDDFEKGLAGQLGAEVAAEVAGLYRWIGRPEYAELYAGDPGAAAARLGIRLTPLRTWIGSA